MRPALLFLAGTLLLSAGCAQQEEATPKLVLIGVDGGSWNVIEPMLEAGELPRLAAIRDRGLQGDLATVEPVISPTVWTSIATGRRPEAHGVTSFFATRRQVRVPTVWERLAAAGLRVGLYDYLITWPPRELPGGFMIPSWLRLDASVEPPDLWQRAETAPFVYEVVDVGGPPAVVAGLERELVEKPRTWNRLFERFDLDAGAVSFYAVDVASHGFYHTAFPEEVEAPVETDPRFDDVVFEMMRGVDRAIGEILDRLDPDDHVVVVSDHGFQASATVIRNWGFDLGWFFKKAGIDAERDGIVDLNGFIFMAVSVEPGPAEDREQALGRLEALVSSVRTPAGEPIFDVEVVRDPLTALESGGLEDWKADVVRHRLPSYAFLFASCHAETLDRLWPDGLVEVSGEAVAGEPVSLSSFAAPHVFTGDHHPTGIFFAAGKAIRHRPERIRLSVLDVAPLLTYLADQPLPDDLDGNLDESWIEPEYLRRHPLRRVAASEAPRLPPEDDVELYGEGGEEIRRRLRALGYIR